MQGFGVRVSPMQAGTPAFKDAIMEVLSNPQYTATAEAMSVKIKARKNTPVQEAAGEHFAGTLVPDTLVACIPWHTRRQGWSCILKHALPLVGSCRLRHGTHAVLSMTRIMLKSLLAGRFAASCPVHEGVQRLT